MRIIIRYTEIYGNSYTSGIEFDERKLVYELIGVISKFIPISPKEMILKTIYDNNEVN